MPRNLQNLLTENIRAILSYTFLTQLMYRYNLRSTTYGYKAARCLCLASSADRVLALVWLKRHDPIAKLRLLAIPLAVPCHPNVYVS